MKSPCKERTFRVNSFQNRKILLDKLAAERKVEEISHLKQGQSVLVYNLVSRRWEKNQVLYVKGNFIYISGVDGVQSLSLNSPYIREATD